jgi:hypothetical protein
MTAFRFGGSSVVWPGELPAALQVSTADPDIIVVRPRAASQTQTPMPDARASPESPSAQPLLTARSPDHLLLGFAGLADFEISTREPVTISPRPEPNTGQETLEHLLLDQVLPRVLAHRGALVLHAGAVQVGTDTIAFIGETGRGKSTLTASFDLAGQSALSDDGLVITCAGHRVLAAPTYPSLRLWPDALESVFESPPLVAPMAHYSTKRRVLREMPTTPPQEPTPLKALYLLGEPAVEDNDTTIESLSERETVMAIIGNSFQLDPSDKARAGRLFEQAAQIAQRLPAFELSYPREFAGLAEVRAAVLRHARTLQ